MKNPEQIRLENKLKLWDTPGFSQFLEDLQQVMGYNSTLLKATQLLKREYKERLKEVEEKKNKFKQGKLPL